MNAQAIIGTKVAMFWLNAHAAAMKSEVLSELESKTRLSGEQPLSSERHAVEHSRHSNQRTIIWLGVDRLL
jgi:hypothetical protein